MRKIWIYAVMAALVGIVSGCLEDDNNYDYKQINDMEGARDKFFNFKNSYSVVEGEELTLAPTFTFTIDAVDPDVSYEWYMDHKLLSDETKPTYTFKSDKCGTYEITIAVVDNKTGVRFAKSTSVQVRSLFQRGWTILSDEGGRSVLHFIVPTTHTYQMMHEGEMVHRDSLVYHQVMHDVVPDLGKNPVGLMENLGYLDYYDAGVKLFDELVVQQDQWAELNGNTLHREVYTYQEFKNDLPADFSPAEACMTYSMKAIRDKNGFIYWANKVDASDFHSGFYTSIGLNDNMQFSRLFQAYKLNDGKTNVVLALTREDNSLVGILDLGTNDRYGASMVIPERSSSESGKVLLIGGDYAEYFSNIQKKIVDALPAVWDRIYGFDVTSAYPAWVTLLKEENSNDYEVRFFTLEASTENVDCSYYYENSLGAISDYRGMAVFNNRCYAVIADGNQLYYYQYGINDENGIEYKGQLMKLGTALPAKVKALSGLDLQGDDSDMVPYQGQLGVALEDGSFYILGIGETRNVQGVCTEVTCKQLFPDENTPEKDKNFGKIVDMIYKIGRGTDYMSFAF